MAIDVLEGADYIYMMNVADIAILYQDHYFLLVNKPAGMVVHPTYKNLDGTMWDEVLAYLKLQGDDDWRPLEPADEPEWAGAPEPVREMLRAKRLERLWREDGLLPRPCLVHRLDKDTSGVVALARTERARRHLVSQFHEHSIAKRYIAVVAHQTCPWSVPQAAFHFNLLSGEETVATASVTDLFSAANVGHSYLVDGALQRDPEERRRCIVGPDGQHAQTRLRVLGAADGFALLEAQPITGRTHQIRAHLAALGCAIVGDQTYAPSALAGTPESLLSRQFLHASSLRFRLYPTNTWSTFTAPLAQDLVQWLATACPPLWASWQTYEESMQVLI